MTNTLPQRISGQIMFSKAERLPPDVLRRYLRALLALDVSHIEQRHEEMPERFDWWEVQP